MILDRLFEKRDLGTPTSNLANPEDWLRTAFGALPTAAEIPVTESNAVQITAFWSAVNTIADTLGELPIKLVRDQANGASKPVRKHSSLDLVRTNPNPMMTSLVYKSTTQAHMLVWGNGASWIKRDRTGVPVELWPLLPSKTSIVVDNGELYFDTDLNIGRTRLKAADVVHLPALSRNGVHGMSIIAEQRETLSANIAANRFGSKFFANGAKPGGLISYPGRVRDPEKVKKAMEEAAGGANTSSMIVLSDDAKYTPFGVPPDDAQFLGTREFGVDEIARMFRLPSHFLNKMGQATFNNLEQMGTHFAQYTMMPWIIRWEQELTRKLLTPEEVARGMKFKFNIAALVRGDIKTRSEVYAKAISYGWMTRNEVRALEDMNSIDGLDEPLIPANLVGIDDDEPDNNTDTPADDEPDSVGADPVENEDDEEESEDERSFVVLQALVQRLANKEANALKRIANKQYDAEQLTDEIAAFYRGHAALLVENLALDAETARQYCQRHALEFVEAENQSDVILRWTTESVSNMVNQLSEDMV